MMCSLSTHSCLDNDDDEARGDKRASARYTKRTPPTTRMKGDLVWCLSFGRLCATPRSVKAVGTPYQNDQVLRRKEGKKRRRASYLLPQCLAGWHSNKQPPQAHTIIGAPVPVRQRQFDPWQEVNINAARKSDLWTLCTMHTHSLVATGFPQSYTVHLARESDAQVVMRGLLERGDDAIPCWANTPPLLPPHTSTGTSSWRPIPCRRFLHANCWLPRPSPRSALHRHHHHHPPHHLMPHTHIQTPTHATKP